MANQQKGVTLPIVALDELLLEKLILLGGCVVAIAALWFALTRAQRSRRITDV